MGKLRPCKATVPPARPGIAARDKGFRKGICTARGEIECVVVVLLPPPFDFFCWPLCCTQVNDGGRLYDDYVVTIDGLGQTVEVKWVSFHSCRRVHARKTVVVQTMN